VTDLHRYLATAELLDCQGRVEHKLILLVDGRIRVERSGTVFVVDPDTGLVDPPGTVLPDHVVHAAGQLTGRPIAVPRDQRSRHAHHHPHPHGGHR